MRPSSPRRFQSLKAKFVGLLLLGGLTAAAIGGWITYRATDSQLQQRLLIRVATLASALNHASMVSTDWSVVQHMIEEVVRDHPDILDIMVVGKSSGEILAASDASSINLPVNKLPDEHLRRELLDALERNHFGYHFEPDHDTETAGNLVIIARLEPAIGLHGTQGGHAGHGAKISPSQKRPSLTKSGDHQSSHDHSGGATHSGGIAKNSTHQTAPPDYRGAILISVAVGGGASIILWRFMVAVLAAIVVILIIAYVAMEFQVLGPIKAIHAAISRRQSGDTFARVSLPKNDEISAVARTLNETLDKEDKQIKTLSNLLNQNEELRNRLQNSSNRVVEINERYLHRIGADLHDGPAQLIAFALLRLDSLKSMLHKKYPEREDSNEISAVYDALRDAMSEIRELSAGLTLAKLEEMSPRTVLDEIISAHQKRIETTVTLDVESVPEWLPLPVKITAFRFIQEGLNNAYEHAQGIDQRVVCRFDHQDLVLEVSDGGPGFVLESAASNNGGLGLIGLRERIENLGGTLSVNSLPGRGTTLVMQCHAREKELDPA
jgi:signal transduction histidine kinase